MYNNKRQCYEDPINLVCLQNHSVFITVGGRGGGTPIWSGFM